MMLVYGMAEFLSTFIEGFIAYLIFSDIFSEKRKRGNRKTDILLSFGITTVALFCNQFALFSYFTLIIVEIYLSVSVCVCYRVNCITAFAVMCFYLTCMNCFDFFVLTLTSNFLSGFHIINHILNGYGAIRMAAITIVNCLWLMVYLILKKYLQQLSVNLKGSYVLLMSSVGGACGFVFLSKQTFKIINDSMSALWFSVMCFFVSVIFISYFSLMQKEEKNKVNFLETRCNLLNESYNSLNEIYRNNAKLYHDLNNHLNLLYQLLQEEKVDEAQRYIKEIAEPILALSKKQWTGIDVADTVLNSKIQEMNERNIMPDINVEFPENSTILPNDLCTILSNLLDNAIEAVEKLDENRKIKLTMRRANFFLFIRVSNPCGQNRKFAVFPATTKENASLHGWGLRSVKDVVERYGGTMECVNENYEFIMNIMLPFDGKN